MLLPNSPSLVADILRSLDPESILNGQNGEGSLATRPVAVEPAPASPGIKPGPEFKSIVHANLRAASQHVMRGHKAPSFRECSHPSCQNASNLIPYPVVVEEGMTDADLQVIFQQLVTTALEELAASPLPAQTSESWNKPELVS